MLREIVARYFLLVLGLLLSAPSGSAATKPNLVLITLDSTRADHVGFLGAKPGLTPNLDRFAAESLVFEHAYAQAPGTIVSHASLLSGAYPQATGMSEIGGAIPASLPYLPDLLKAQGYRTAAFVGSIQLDPRNGTAQGFDRGFQAYDAGFRPPIAGDARLPVTARPASQVVANALAWLARNPAGPAFVWIHLNDPANASPATYNVAITAADSAVGKLLAALKQQKLYANTSIIVAADHGKSLGAHGEDASGIFLYDETIHVPLLLKMPEAQPAKRIAAKVRLTDVAPTLLEIAGIPVPSQMQGQSLLRIAKSSAGADQPVYSRSDLPARGFGWSPLESWRAGKYLYIRAPKPELYDMTADPGATRNLAQSSKATVDTMAGQLDSFDRRFSGDSGKSSNAQLNSAEMQKLASLGYVGLQKTSGTSSAATGTDPKDKIAAADKVADAARALDEGKADRAIAALTPLVSSEPGIYVAEYTLGTALAQKGQHAEAVKHLHKAIELQPDSAWAHYRMGASLLKMGDFKTAAIHLEIAAGRLPPFGPAHLALAEAYEKLGRAADAKKARGEAGLSH
jgi:arylsulfatase A-like enzyme/Tfp pilus assembly protein PilF